MILSSVSPAISEAQHAAYAAGPDRKMTPDIVSPRVPASVAPNTVLRRTPQKVLYRNAWKVPPAIAIIDTMKHVTATAALTI